VKLVDANLFLFAWNSSAPEHEQASHWLEEAFWADEPVATSWSTVLSFLRLTTSKVFPSPMTTREATSVVEAWFSEAGLRVLEPTDRHWRVMRELLDASGARGNLVADVHLAALAIEHGATLCTDDLDFKRFSGLKVELPLRRRAKH
jgi:uncharacterized protein